ncbi:MAG: nucleoside triphosphate pyrophosphohydrolase [Verrucomicrobiia bacterium]
MIKPIEKLEAIVATLRDPEKGCPWDRKQTHASLKRAFLEECYEVLEAIDLENPDHLKEELGDILFHVMFHAQVAHEKEIYDFDAVADSICNKLIARHPHVFEPFPSVDARQNKIQVNSVEDVIENWQALKAKEKADRESALDGVPPALPALLKAHKLQEKAAHVGFDWSKVEQILDKIQEEIEELRHEINSHEPEKIQEELGDLFFSLVNLSRFLHCDAEATLQAANTKFETRFRLMENRLKQKKGDLKNCSIEEMEQEWQNLKDQDQPHALQVKSEESK